MRYGRVAVPVLCLALAAACGSDDSVNTGAGTINVAVNPATSPLDPDGFTAKIDNGTPQAIPELGGLQVPGMIPGEHKVTLGDVDSPCRVTTDNPLTVQVVGGETVTASFKISCVSDGFINITTHTTGDDPDPDGYALAVDGEAAPLIGVNDNATVVTTEGNHDVTLSEVAANCAVQGGDTQSVTVSGGNTSPITFEVVCTAVN